MTQNRREILRQQRLRRRRIFYLCCVAFLLIVAILIGILIHRLSGSDDAAPVSDPVAESTEESSSETILPPGGTAPDSPSLSLATGFMQVLHSEVRQTAIENSIPVIAPPSGYELRFMSEQDLHTGNLLLINKQHEYLFYDFADTTELISMYDIMGWTYDVSGTDVMMQQVAAEPLNQMLSDFYDNTWMDNLLILCGYRTKEESQQLYDESALLNGTEHADMYVMKPGFSEHHSALSADIGIINWDGSITYEFFEEPYSWLTSNCHKYGFVLRYPEDKADITEIGFESWHFRFVGVPNATAMVNEGYVWRSTSTSLRATPPAACITK